MSSPNFRRTTAFLILEMIMRVVQNQQMQMGEVDISQIKFDPKSRDDIPKILRGLQHLYRQLPVRTAIFELLEARLAPPDVNKNTGRPGMTLWTILVLGVIRLDLNIDYDRLHELANKHSDIRAMLGHGIYNETYYHHQTLKDNIRMFTPELLDEINQLVVNAGHVLVKKEEDEALRGRCDSFVVKTDIHFPTDVSLLFDAMRKVITLLAQWCQEHELSDWRQSAYNIRSLKRQLRTVQNKKRSKAQSEEVKAKNDAAILEAYQAYLKLAEHYLAKARQSLVALAAQEKTDILAAPKQSEIEHFMEHAVRQIDQITRRVLHGEVIPHSEKVFSIFEPHTEWISKGKAGVPVEFGIKVCILEDQYQFILHHHVMEKQTDEEVAISMVSQAKKRFATLNACSFDKGFHSPANQTQLAEHLEQVTLPRKGKLSQQAKALEQSEAFTKARRAHSGVESAINALDVHGLDKCQDHGIDGFKRYVALAILARNIHRIGHILWLEEQQQLAREAKRTKYKPPDKLAA
jgi:transposase, IS5 family